MDGRWIATLISCVLLAASTLAASVDEKAVRAEHPGCLVWWFVSGCPLGNVFGVDPLGIYPWKKFCREYSAFEDLQQCKDLHEEAEVKKVVEEEEKTAVARTPKQLQEATKEKKDEDKLCRSSFNYYNANLKRCRQLMGKGFKKHLQRVFRREIGGNVYGGADVGFRLPSHPGCTYFWFLRGCPLGDIFGVDPLGQYPWDALCQYRSMQHDETRCQKQQQFFETLN